MPLMAGISLATEWFLNKTILSSQNRVITSVVTLKMNFFKSGFLQ